MAMKLATASFRYSSRNRIATSTLLAPLLRQFSVSRYGSSAAAKEPVEEELVAGHDRLAAFHPTEPRQDLNGQFRTIAKLGFGSGSTVWLAEKLQTNQSTSIPHHVAIKIAALDTDASGESRHSKIICNADPLHEGRSFIRTPIDEFVLQGPRGSHSCLVYEPMRESLDRLQHRFDKHKLPVPLFKLYVFFLLEALDYLHTECRLIHTDIKADNIMMTFEDEYDLDGFVDSLQGTPTAGRVRTDGRTIYPSYEFGHLLGFGQLPKLADFDQAFEMIDGGRGHFAPIQAHAYRAPEVLLGCEWTYSVDIWNLGLLMWKLLENISFFDLGEDEVYDAHVHLARMANLLGNPPSELVERENNARHIRLNQQIINPSGKVCKNTNEYWDGPFFDDHGRIIRTELLKQDGDLASSVVALDGDEKACFLDFSSHMLQWLPEKRKTAKELLDHEFLEQVRQYRAESTE